jgi:hypothetical protein
MTLLEQPTPALPAPITTGFPHCNPTGATVKGSEATRLHALLPGVGVCLRRPRPAGAVAETQPALLVHPAALHPPGLTPSVLLLGGTSLAFVTDTLAASRLTAAGRALVDARLLPGSASA